jgi:endonuclease/exonuclease/phosphatase family metal-dependent hydrolase
MIFKVLSYNIHKGLSTGNLKFILPQIRSVLHEINPDFVCLQEVLGHHVRHKKHLPERPDISQFEYLAREIWPHFAYGKNAVYQKGHHGNAILSRYPIRSSKNMNVSTNRLEKRGILHAVVELSEGKHTLHVMCVHFGLSESGRRKQIAHLIRQIRLEVPSQEQLIVAGDFNDWKGRLAFKLWNEAGLEESFMKLHGRYAETFPVWLPVFRLDRIYFRGLIARDAICLSAKPWNQLSDHASLVSDFEIQ